MRSFLGKEPTGRGGARFGGCFLAAMCALGASAQVGLTPTPPELRQGRELLAAKQFPEALKVFAAYGKAHPESVPAALGVGDAELGLKRYEAAELTLRRVTARQPELWQAHKNLVVVEAALGRWEEFDRERAVLALARRRGAPGISARESDVIDGFDTPGGHWVVRAYFEPVGRAQARYNFEEFSPEGKVLRYISLEDAAAAQAALTPGDERVGAGASSGSLAGSGAPSLALNWYTGRAHGTIQAFSGTEPSYERLRADVLGWVKRHPAAEGAR